MKRKLIAGLMSATMVGGGGMAAALQVAATARAAGAEESSTTTTSSSASSTRPSREDMFKSALDPLVSAGTINQSQQDAVIQALKDAAPARDGIGKGPRGHGGRGGMFHPRLDAAAEALGMSEDELKAALESGKSLEDVATDKGIDKQKVIDALVAELKAHLDEEVSEGDLTAEQRDKRLAEATKRITENIDKVRPARP